MATKAKAKVETPDETPDASHERGVAQVHSLAPPTTAGDFLLRVTYRCSGEKLSSADVVQALKAHHVEGNIGDFYVGEIVSATIAL